MKSIRVVAAIIKDKDKILATKRSYGEFKGGWEFPGGKIEEGEDKKTALIREIKEETKFEKDKRIETIIENNGYCELENSPSQYDKFIEMSAFNQLTNEKRNLYLYYTQYNSFYLNSL